MKTYREGDYLSGFECQRCGATDKLFYNDCPCCEENFVECGACGGKWSQDTCEATLAEN